MNERTINTSSGDVTYVPGLLDTIEHLVDTLGIDGKLLLDSLGFLHVVKFIESRDDLSSRFTDEFAGELLIETQRFMESFAISYLDDDLDSLN